MSNQITTAFVKQFGDTVSFLSQQKGARVFPLVRVRQEVTGEVAFFDQIGSTAAVRTNTRHADSPLVETPHARRRVSLIDVEWGDLVDKFDLVRTLIDPTNPYTQNAAWAIAREMDKVVIEKFFADAATGKDGTGTATFPASQTIEKDFGSTGTNTGLTIGKLREARRILLGNNVDPTLDGPLHIVISAKQLDDLLGTTEVTSADFNTVRALVQGEITTFMGFNFVHSELLETKVETDTLRRVPVFAANGMAVAMGLNPMSRIVERSDKRFSTYVYHAVTLGATRLEEEKVVEIECKE